MAGDEGAAGDGPPPGTGLPEPFDATLRDGTRAHIRPIRPDDKGRLQSGLALLSPRSRYYRFHTPVRRLSQGHLRYLTEIDYRNHMAWVALNPDAPEEPGMGVARYIRLRREPTVAEAAVTVLDHYQGKGLGTLLLECLSRTAVENGVEVFRNYVLAENSAMLGVFDRLGAARAWDGDGVYRVDFALVEHPTQASTAQPVVREALRGAARGELPPFALSAPVEWLRRVAGHLRGEEDPAADPGDGDPPV